MCVCVEVNMCNIAIHEYVDKIEFPKHKNTYLRVKRFFDIRREIHNLSMLTFPSVPHHVRHPTQGLGELRKSTFFFGGKNSTLTFLKPPKSSALLGMMSFTSSGPISYLGFYFDICE